MGKRKCPPPPVGCGRKDGKVLSALGLRWVEIGSEKPQVGSEIINKSLAKALEGQKEFTQEEFNAFQVSGLMESSYVHAGDAYLKSVVFEQEAGPCPQCAPGRDCFSTIIAVTNSAIKKLTLNDVTPLAPSRNVL